MSLVLVSCNGNALADGLYAEIQTSRGLIVVELFPDKAPLTVANFVGLAEGTLGFAEPAGRFYDGLTFHRVIGDFMIQGGDPLGNGTGGPGYKFVDETFNGLSFDKPGVLAMANSGPDSNGSQFFITHVPTPHLDGRHTIFGQVSLGQDVVDMVEADDKMESVKIIRKGKKARKYQVDNAFFEKVQSEAVENQARAMEAKREANINFVREKWPEAVLQDGIYVIVKNEGVGDASRGGEQARLHYSISLINGTKIENSRDREGPIEITLGAGEVFEAWDKAMVGMRREEHRTLIIPPEMAFGDQALGPIPPNSWLLLDVEILDFKEQ